MITTPETTMELQLAFPPSLSPSPSPVIINGSSNSSPSSVTKHKPTKKKKNLNPNHASSSSVFKSSAIAPCTECGKRFHSWKALFGHMRCHPDRPYRGMNPNPRKPKPKAPKLKQIRNWEHVTDGVIRAALILMEMSGQPVEHIVESMKERVDGDSRRLIDTQRKFAELEIVA